MSGVQLAGQVNTSGSLVASDHAMHFKLAANTLGLRLCDPADAEILRRAKLSDLENGIMCSSRGPPIGLPANRSMPCRFHPVLLSIPPSSS